MKLKESLEDDVKDKKMTNPEVALLMLGLFIVLVLLGFPIAFTLLAMGVAFGYYAYHQGGSIETFSDIFNNNIFYPCSKQ